MTTGRTPQVSWSIVLDHAAVAVSDPEKLKKVLQLLGLKDHGSESIESQQVLTHFLKAQPSQPAIEILEPTSTDGTVAKFLRKKGPGIHHLSFQVSDIEAVTQMLQQEKIRLIYDAAQSGAHNTLVNFIHPESTGGVLLEISQKRS